MSIRPFANRYDNEVCHRFCSAMKLQLVLGSSGAAGVLLTGCTRTIPMQWSRVVRSVHCWFKPGSCLNSALPSVVRVADSWNVWMQNTAAQGSKSRVPPVKVSYSRGFWRNWLEVLLPGCITPGPVPADLPSGQPTRDKKD